MICDYDNLLRLKYINVTGVLYMIMNFIFLANDITIIIGFGLASHLGVLTGIPTIGVGKNMYFIDGMTKDDDFKQKVSLSFLTAVMQIVHYLFNRYNV